MDSAVKYLARHADALSNGNGFSRLLKKSFPGVTERDSVA
jgi:hypothetical protein